MKVQRKQGHEQYEVFEQTDKYYLAKADYWRNIITLPKTDYEPVQEWVDVTQYCNITLVDSARDEYAICYANDLVESPFKKDVYKVTRNDKTGVIKVERKKV